jgi:hypothetical protein
MSIKRIHFKKKSANVKRIGNRIVGCQSTNHMSCKGELWECERCHKIICWEEGSADLPELCDDCWYDIEVLHQEFSIGNVSYWRLKYETT